MIIIGLIFIVIGVVIATGTACTFTKVRKFRDNQWHSARTIDGKSFVGKSQIDQEKRIH